MDDYGIDYETIPEHCRDRLRAYVERGEPVGDFLTAILSNDLVGAFARADGTNLLAIQDYAAWLWNDAPSPCWGSELKIQAWRKKGGLKGSSLESA